MEKLLQQYGVQQLSLAEGALSGAAYWINQRSKKVILISDINTQFVGKPLVHEQHVFSEVVKPEKLIAEDLARRYADKDFFVAIGSGTISDLVKYASYLVKKPYVMLPTAPSMNGYLSITASLIDGAKKESYQAHLPVALFADLNVLAEAPQRLIRAGVGDSICRPTAQADWLLSHYLLGTEYNPEPFNMVEKHEKYIYANAPKLLDKNKEAIRILTEWLLLGGLGMTVSGGSYPASQGEHMIAHTMEMLYGDQLPQTCHGEQIGVTTLVMTDIQAKLLANETPLYLPKSVPEKGINSSKINEINNILATKWSEIRQEILKVTKSYMDISDLLRVIAAPRTPESLGWPSDWFAEAMVIAPTTRDRFTFLDMDALTKF